MTFEFATADRIVFGPGVFAQAAEIAAGLARRWLIVLGSRSLEQQGLATELSRSLAGKGSEGVSLSVEGEPDVESVDAGVRQAREAGCEGVIGLGGGSAIDTAKAIGALLTNGGQALDYMEVVGRGQKLGRPSAPVIAIPTTAGTGAEVTRNAVIAHRESGLKASLRSPYLLPRVALVDPTLTHSLPPLVTATTGMDALTQLIEPIVSRRAQPLTDALAMEGLPRVARSLTTACLEPRNAAAREDMALASLLGGLALANSGLGAVHGFAAALGGSYAVPHGTACAALLAPVMRINVRALRERDPQGPFLPRYGKVAEALLGQRLQTPTAAIDAAIWFIYDLCQRLQVPSLSHFGVTVADMPSIVEKARAASSMKANPIDLTQTELEEILTDAIGN